MSKSRKTFLRLFLCFFIFSSAALPVRQAEAIVPLIALGVAAVTTAGITITAADVAGLAIAAAGMGALLYLKLTAPDGSAVAVPAQDASIHPAAIVPVPSAPASASITPAPTIWAATYIGGGFTSTGAMVNACQVYMGAGSPYVCSYGAGDPWMTRTNTTNGTVDHTMLVSTSTGAPTCPVGYTVTGTAPNQTCNLSNARAVTQDNRQDYGRTGQVYAPYSGDLVGTVTGIAGVTSASGDSISFQGQGASGQNTSITVVATSGGGSIVTQTTQAVDTSGATYLKQSTITIGSDGSVVSTSSANLTGSLTGTTGANGGLTVAAAPATSIAASPTAQTTSSVVFPSDYARSGEAATAANTITGTLAPRLDVIGNALTQTGTVADPALPVVGDMPVWGNTFTNLLSWTLPGHSSVCPQPSMDLSVMHLGTHTLSAHCNLLANNAAPLHSSMVLVFTIIALFIVLGA